MCGHIERIVLLSTRPQLDFDMKDMLSRISLWIDTVRRWDQESVPSLNLAALLLLFNVAMALLPSSEVVGFSYAVNEATIDFVVDRATKYLGVRHKAGGVHQDLHVTLTTVLRFVVRLFPHSASHGRAVLLLEQLQVGG